MADDHVIDIRRYLDQSQGRKDEGAFAVWGGGGDRSSFALPLCLKGEEVPSLVFTKKQELAVLLGEDDERRWFLQLLGGSSGTALEGKARETLLFLAGECAGLLFFRELATPFPSSASTP